MGAGDGLEESAVLDLLIHLVEKSLVTLEAGGERLFLPARQSGKGPHV